jgi:hypothetical protein
MKRLDLWKAKLKAAKAELRIRDRDVNAAMRAVNRVLTTIEELENKIVSCRALPSSCKIIRRIVFYRKAHINLLKMA